MEDDVEMKTFMEKTKEFADKYGIRKPFASMIEGADVSTLGVKMSDRYGVVGKPSFTIIKGDVYDGSVKAPDPLKTIPISAEIAVSFATFLGIRTSKEAYLDYLKEQALHKLVEHADLVNAVEYTTEESEDLLRIRATMFVKIP